LKLALSQRAIGSQLVDNLNASIHLRALPTDLFLISGGLRSKGFDATTGTAGQRRAGFGRRAADALRSHRAPGATIPHERERAAGANLITGVRSKSSETPNSASVDR
jgi:hypothetical protein